MDTFYTSRLVEDSLLNLVPGYSGKTGCFGTIVVNVGDVENSGSNSAIPQSWSIDSGSGWIFATDSYVDEIVRCSLSGLHPTSGASCV